jgi:hypothetical protein
LEVDLVLEIGQKLHLFEIKSAMTILPKHASTLLRIAGDLKSSIKTLAIISTFPENFPVKMESITTTGRVPLECKLRKRFSAGGTGFVSEQKAISHMTAQG